MNKENKENKVPSRNTENNKYNRSSIGQIGKMNRVSLNNSTLKEYENIADQAVELIFNNKINSKNAFDVNVSFMENLPSFINQSIEASWQKASASLDASAKIYGYRVDSVHTETFKFLGGLNRAEQRSDENEAKLNDEKKKLKKITSNGDTTLEKDLSKINVDKFDLTFDVDALFKMMTAKFSDSGARGLILKSLPLDENLDILLESNATNNLNFGKKRNSNDFRKMSNNNKTLTTVIENSLSNFQLKDFQNSEICPDLMIFKESRKLETSILPADTTFIENLMNHDMSQYERRNDENFDSEHENSIIFDEFQNIKENYSCAENSPSEDQIFEENFIQNVTLNNKNISRFDGFSYLKNEDMKQFICSFGDGNKDILKKCFKDPNQFLNQDKFKIENERKNKAPLKKVKKEEKMFKFNQESLIKTNEIFEETSKQKGKKILNATHRKENKRKIRNLFNYDPLHLFNLFTFENVVDNEMNAIKRFKEQQSQLSLKQNNIKSYDDNQDLNENETFHNQSNYDISKFTEKENENIHNFDKKFGKLYKTFDVGFVKMKIWDTINIIKPNEEKKLTFDNIIDKISETLDTKILNNISTSTCFVCLLHLANEKNLQLEEINANFSIQREI